MAPPPGRCPGLVCDALSGPSPESDIIRILFFAVVLNASRHRISLRLYDRFRAVDPWEVLNASRHRISLRIRRRIDTTAALMCSTPLGIGYRYAAWENGFFAGVKCSTPLGIGYRYAQSEDMARYSSCTVLNASRHRISLRFPYKYHNENVLCAQRLSASDIATPRIGRAQFAI